MLGDFTNALNIRHKLCGHLFAGRYKAVAVDGSGSGYLRTVCDYVHLNPVRARLLKPKKALETFAWSSYGEYLKPSRQRPGWLRVDRLLGEKGIPRDSAAGRRQFALDMERRRTEELAMDHGEIRRVWCLGSEEFRQELLAAAGKRVGPSHHGGERTETGIQKAERIVQEELGRLGWRADELSTRLKGDKAKVRLAGLLRKETTMTLKWIAERLHMGSWTYVSNLLQAKAQSGNRGRGRRSVNSED